MSRGFYLVFEGPNRSGKTTQRDKLIEYLKEKYPNKEIVSTREPGAGSWQSEIADDIRDVVQGQTAQSFSEPMHPLSEACLYAASRSQTLRMVVRPALQNGAIVVADRSLISSMAFQGAGREAGIGFIHDLNWQAVNLYDMCGRKYKQYEQVPQQEGEIADAIRVKFFSGRRGEYLHPVTAMYLHAVCAIQHTGKFPDLPTGPVYDQMLPDCVLYLDLTPEELQRRALNRGDDKFDGMSLLFHGKVREGYLQIKRAQYFKNWVTVDGYTGLPVEESIAVVHERIKDALNPYLP